MAKNKIIDVAVIGAGAAGMSAAIYAKRQGLDVVLFDKVETGGMTAVAADIENYLGFGKIRGAELAKKFAEHLRASGADVRENTEVRSLKRTGSGEAALFELATESGKANARSVIITTGTEHRKLGIPGEDEFHGRGVSNCVVCDGPFFRGMDIAVVGGGNSGAVAALDMLKVAKNIYILEYGPELNCEAAYKDEIAKSRIRVLTNAQVSEIFGDDNGVAGLKYKDRKTGKEKSISVKGVFVYVGIVAETALPRDLGVEMDNGFVRVDQNQQTNVPGLFAAGDATTRLKQISVAVGDGAVAALSAYRYLRLR